MLVPKSSFYTMSSPLVWTGEKRRSAARILPKSGGYFVHVTSRTKDKAFLFGPEEKTAFLELARRWAVFSGISMVTHCMMSNHFHLLLWVPDGETAAKAVDHAEVLWRLGQVWSKDKVDVWESFYQAQDAETQEKMMAEVTRRMFDLGAYMRVLKQGFSCWYNRRAERVGTLWEGRYRSVVVEGNPLALMSVAAYIDLNPVRAGICEEPMDYHWNGYAEACAGGIHARLGLELLVRMARGQVPRPALMLRARKLRASNNHQAVWTQMETEAQTRKLPTCWEDVQRIYRLWLMSKGKTREGDLSTTGKIRKRPGFRPEDVIAEYERMGEVPMAQLLRHRWRYFTKGVAIGGTVWLEEMMAAYRDQFGDNRQKAGRRMRGKGWDGLEVLRATA